MLRKIKGMLTQPVTAEWVDRVVTENDRRALEIEKQKGPEAAQKYREESGRKVAGMIRRGIIPPG